MEEELDGSENELTPTEYEKLTQSIYQLLIQEQGHKNIEVKHNTTVTGKSGATHQVDVYWEFQIAGKTYKTFIECKHYKSAVSIGHIRNFYGVLEDVGTNGIFVTKVGYQSGAEKFAKYYGIDTKVIKPTEESDLKDRIRKIVINLHIKTVSKKPPPQVGLEIEDKDSLGNPIDVNYLSELNLKDPRTIQNEMGALAHFRDLAGQSNAETIGEFLPANLPVLELEKGGPYDKKILLTDKYIQLGKQLVRAKALNVVYHVEETISVTETEDALAIYSHILKDFQTGNIEFMKKA